MLAARLYYFTQPRVIAPLFSAGGAWPREIWQVMWHVVAGGHHVHPVSFSPSLSWTLSRWVLALQTDAMLLHRLTSDAQIVWIPSLLLQPRPGHLSWHEEEDQDGTIRVSQPRVVGRVGGRWESAAGPVVCAASQSWAMFLSGGKSEKCFEAVVFVEANHIITANSVNLPFLKCNRPITS